MKPFPPNLFKLKQIAFLLVCLFFSASSGFAQKESSEFAEYYVTLGGDTVRCNILRLKPRSKKLYHYLKGRGYYVRLDSVKGFSEKRGGYREIEPKFLDSLNHKYWRKDVDSSLLGRARLGLGVGVQISLLNTNFNRYDSYKDDGAYPYFSKVNWVDNSPVLKSNSNSYKDAYGFVRREMPYIEIVYRDAKLSRLALNIGYRRAQDERDYFFGFQLDQISLIDRYFKISYDRPILKSWVRTKTKSSGIKYPLYGLDISINTKSLQYEYSSYGITNVLYDDFSVLLLVQAKLGLHKEIRKMFYTYGLNFNLYGFANGSFNLSTEHVGSFVQEYNYTLIEQGSYSKHLLLKEFILHNVFFIAGYRF